MDVCNIKKPDNWCKINVFSVVYNEDLLSLLSFYCVQKILLTMKSLFRGCFNKWKYYFCVNVIGKICSIQRSESLFILLLIVEVLVYLRNINLIIVYIIILFVYIHTNSSYWDVQAFINSNKLSHITCIKTNIMFVVVAITIATNDI